MAAIPPKKPSPLKQDHQLFLDALASLMDEQRTLLVEELVSKMGTIPIAMPSGNSTIVRHQKAEASSDIAPIEIDDSTFVVEQKLDGVQKGFDKLTESETTQDAEASRSIDKLRNLKREKN